MSDGPPPDYIDGAIDIICVAGGFALIAYLKVHYASDLGDWLLALVGYGPA